jgi:hypothetical protein
MAGARICDERNKKWEGHGYVMRQTKMAGARICNETNKKWQGHGYVTRQTRNGRGKDM